MEDKDIQILMNQSWSKMAVKLDQKIPVNKRKNRWILWIFLFLSVPTIGGLCTYWIDEINLNNGNIIDLKNNVKPNTTTRHSNPNDIVSLKTTSHLLSPVSQENTAIKYGTNLVSEQTAKYKNNKKLNFHEENIALKKEMLSTENKISQTHLINNTNDITPSVGKRSDEHLTKEILYNGNENNVRKNISLNFLTSNVSLSRANKPITLPEIKVFEKQKLSYLTMGVVGTANFNGFRKPIFYSAGIFVQKVINNNFFVEGSLSFKSYNRYITFLQNDGQSNKINKDMDLLSMPGNLGNSIYFKNTNSLNYNQITIANESILSNTLESVSYISSSMKVGYRLNSTMSIVSGFGLERFIGATYTLNNPSTSLFRTINKAELTKDNLQNGNELIRKWIPTGQLGIEFQVTKSMSVSSVLNFGRLEYKSVINGEINITANSAITTLDKSLIDFKTPEKGNLSLELGMRYRLK